MFVGFRVLCEVGLVRKGRDIEVGVWGFLFVLIRKDGGKRGVGVFYIS